MDKVAIVGTGLMGRSWAVVFANAGFQVALHDPDLNAIARTFDEIERGLRHLEWCDFVEDASAVRKRISAESELPNALRNAEYVQESIEEQLEAKTSVFRQMDELSDPYSILASSSAGISASVFSEKLRHRKRCLVAHSFEPANAGPHVEVVPAPWTAAETVSRTKIILSRAGKHPIVVKRMLQSLRCVDAAKYSSRP